MAVLVVTVQYPHVDLRIDDMQPGTMQRRLPEYHAAADERTSFDYSVLYARRRERRRSHRWRQVDFRTV